MVMNLKLPISETAPHFFETALESPETHQGPMSCQRAELANYFFPFSIQTFINSKKQI